MNPKIKSPIIQAGIDKNKALKLYCSLNNVRINPNPFSLISSCSKSKNISLLPPKSEVDKKRKTLVLDIDETLVHSSFDPVPNEDLILPVIENSQ